MRLYLVFAVFLLATISLAACGDDDYGQVLDLGQDLTAVVDGAKHD